MILYGYRRKNRDSRTELFAVLLGIALFVIPGFGQESSPASTDFENLSKRATAAREAGRTEEAIALYKDCLKLQPNWNEGWWNLGTLYYGADRYVEALPAFQNLTTLDSHLGPPYALLGLCEFETHDYKDALLNLQRGRTLGLRGNAELGNVSCYHEALILNLTGRFEAATDLLVSLASRGMTAESVKVAFGMVMLRVPLLPAQLDASRIAVIHSAGDIGVMAAQNNYDQADAAFRRLLSEYPRTPFLHYAYGSLLTTMTRLDDAEREFKAEVQITPKSAMPYMQLAYIDLATNRNQDALSAARHAIALEPKSFAAHYFAGRALLEQGKVAESLKELETARQLEPSSPEVHYNLARAYAKAQRPQDAARERAEFSRLNSPVVGSQEESKRQSYGTSFDRGTFQPPGLHARSAQP